MAPNTLQQPSCASMAAAQASITLCEDLGRLFLLDMVLGNAGKEMLLEKSILAREASCSFYSVRHTVHNLVHLSERCLNR